MWPYTERETVFFDPPRPRGELAARTLAMPADTNPAGDIFGGWIVSMMDSAGAITATRRGDPHLLSVEVWVLRQGLGDRVKVTEGEFTFVALDEFGEPRPLESALAKKPRAPTPPPTAGASEAAIRRRKAGR